MPITEISSDDNVPEVVGFDLRKWGPSFKCLWTDQRKEAFLINPAVSFPLSVDPMSWPSIFDDGTCCYMPEDQRDDLGLGGIEMPEFVGLNPPFWESLKELEAHMNDEECKFIQVIRCGETETTADIQQKFSDRFTLIGFDVADLGYVSSLSNCQFQPTELAELRNQFAPALNEFHLFREIGPARQFRVASDKMVTEHSPFFVYAIGGRD